MNIVPYFESIKSNRLSVVFTGNLLLFLSLLSFTALARDQAVSDQMAVPQAGKSKVFVTGKPKVQPIFRVRGKAHS